MTYASAVALALFFMLMGIHYILLCTGGEGMNPRQISGIQMFYVIADTSFLAVLLLIAKGWAIVRRKLSAVGRIKLSILLSSYVFLQLFLLGWEVQAFSDASAAQSYRYFNPPSVGLLALRVVALLEFSWALFTTFSNFKAKKRFYVKFAIFGGLWIGLPVVVTVSSAAINDVFRDGVVYGNDVLGLVICQFVLIFLFCPLEINKSFPFHQISTSMKTELDLRNAATNGDLKTVQSLVLLHPEWVNSELDKNTGATALMFAASRGHLNVIKYLISIPFIKIQQEDKAGFTALRYCEDADKEFAHMNEMLHLLGLDTPPVEMLWDMGQTPEEVSSLGLQAFPDEFKGFKGNHIEKVTKASEAMTHKLSRLMKTVNGLKELLEKLQPSSERNDLVVEGTGLDDKQDGRDDSHFDERDLDRNDDHNSEQKTNAQHPRDDDEFKTQNDGADEQPRERKRRERRPAEPDNEQKTQEEADRVQNQFREQEERGKDLLQREHEVSQSQLADRLEQRRGDRRRRAETAGDEAKLAEAGQEMNPEEKQEEHPEDKPEEDASETQKSQRRRRRRRKENDEVEQAAADAPAEAADNGEGEAGEGETGEKKKKRSKRSKRSRRRERADDGKEQPDDDDMTAEKSERKSRRRRDKSSKRRRRRKAEEGGDDAPKDE